MLIYYIISFDYTLRNTEKLSILAEYYENLFKLYIADACPGFLSLEAHLIFRGANIFSSDPELCRKKIKNSALGESHTRGWGAKYLIMPKDLLLLTSAPYAPHLSSRAVPY